VSGRETFLRVFRGLRFFEQVVDDLAQRPRRASSTIEAASTRWFWIWTTAQAASVAAVAYAASMFVSRAATSLSVDGTQTLERYARALFSL
jgi:hypothetical protein